MSGAGRDAAAVDTHAAVRRSASEVVGRASMALAAGSDVEVPEVEGSAVLGGPLGREASEPLVGPLHGPGHGPVLWLDGELVIDLRTPVADHIGHERDGVPASREVTATAHRPPVRSAATTWWGRAFKRGLDLAVALPVAAVAVVLLPLLVVAIRLDSRGPVFFRQQRVGRHGRPIWVVKVRTMHPDAEARLLADPDLFRQYVTNGFKLADRCDPRVTRVGRWLRRTSLDELPQVFCVLRGEMALVGPRPVLPGELDHLYRDLVPYYVAVKPGLTGLWQVSGRSTVTNRERAEIDAWYVHRWTPLVDLRILARTPAAVIGADGAC